MLPYEFAEHVRVIRIFDGPPRLLRSLGGVENDVGHVGRPGGIDGLLDFIGARCDVSHHETERVAELRVAVDEMFRQRLREGAAEAEIFLAAKP
ncbi:MAG: hypothetical protein WAL59_16670 [Roseiarcus sp.]